MLVLAPFGILAAGSTLGFLQSPLPRRREDIFLPCHFSPFLAKERSPYYGATPYAVHLADLYQPEYHEDNRGEEDQKNDWSHSSNPDVIGGGRDGRNGCVHPRDKGQGNHDTDCADNELLDSRHYYSNLQPPFRFSQQRLMYI